MNNSKVKAAMFLVLLAITTNCTTPKKHSFTLGPQSQTKVTIAPQLTKVATVNGSLPTDKTLADRLIICAMDKKGNLIPSCGPDPNHPAAVPCANPDGTFIVLAGASLQFGLLNYDGISCSKVNETGVIQ